MNSRSPVSDFRPEKLGPKAKRQITQLSALPVVARTLSVSLMELFGEESPQDKPANRRRGPMPQWQQHIEAIAKLPRSRQQFVAEMLRNVLGDGAPQ